MFYFEYKIFDVLTCPIILKYFIYKILEINPCGVNRPLVIKTTDSGFIDSSVLAFDDNTLLNCKWKLKVARDKSLTVTADNIKLDNRWVYLQFIGT